MKDLPAMQEDQGLIPRLGRSPEKENGTSLHYSCLENFMDRGAWRTIVHGVTKELDMTDHTCTQKSKNIEYKCT